MNIILNTGIKQTHKFNYKELETLRNQAWILNDSLPYSSMS